MKADRRQFLRTGAAIAAGFPLAADAARLEHSPAHPAPFPFYRAIVDDRFAAARQWGEAMQASGYTTSPTRDGDVTRLWYDDLARQWARGPVAVAGLTAHGPLFCLTHLAAPLGMRVAVAVRVWSGEAAGSVGWMKSRERWAEAAATGDDAPDDEALYAWVIAPKGIMPAKKTEDVS